MVIDLKNSTVKIKDGGSEFIEVKLGTGNVTWSEKMPREYIKDRGVIDTVRNADEEPMDVKLDAQYSFLRGTSEASIEDALKQRGEASAWVSTSADPCEPYAVDIEITHNPECPGVESEVVVLPDFRYESIDHDPKAGTLSITGKSNAREAIVTRPGSSS